MAQNLLWLLALKKRTPYLVRGLRVDKLFMTKFWRVARITNFMVLKKFKKPISRFPIEISSFFFFFFFSFFCVHYFSFVLVTIIRTTKGQRTNKK